MVIKKAPITLEELYLLEGNRLLLLEELNAVIANSLALTAVVLGSNIPNYKTHDIHEYFNAIDTLLQKTQELCVQLINTYFESKFPLKNELKYTSDSAEAENFQFST
jgi:hypothetical protein